MSNAFSLFSLNSIYMLIMSFVVCYLFKRLSKLK